MKAVFLLGATATGKSKTGAILANKINGEVISLDSMQVYKGLPILSAQPGEDELYLAPHHLVDILSPSMKFDVFSYLEAVEKILKQLNEQNKPAVFVGGTTYYFKALVDGFDDLPGGSDDVRAQIISEIGDDAQALHEYLSSLDKVSAERIHVNDKKKVIRAIEVCRLTGKPMSEQLGKNPDGGIVKDFVAWSIHLPREELYERINKRVDAMMKTGALEEVEQLWKTYGTDDFTIHQALGVRQLLAHFRDGTDLEECITLLKRDTRRFSKRQLSFLRGEPRITPLNIHDFVDYEAIASWLEKEYRNSR